MTLPLSQVIAHQQDALLDQWLRDLSKPASESSFSPVHPDLAEPLRRLFRAIMAQLDEPQESVHQAALDKQLQQLIAEQARLQRSLSDTLGYLLHLKHLLLKALLDSADQARDEGSILWLDQCFEQIARQTFEHTLAQRDRYISEQSLSIMELSTPVLRLWHQILLLPLVGVIDTGRARQITDHLLEAIAKYEARVTVIDLTGVPIIDTSVAQHIMKTIDAARLLGSRVVLTGISPEGAQTLTKLGIRFGDVISRASLRAGIAEALLITGKRISAMETSPR